MGTLDREKGTYEWEYFIGGPGVSLKSAGSDWIQAAKAELYRLAVLAEDQAKDVLSLQSRNVSLALDKVRLSDQLETERKVIRAQQDTIARLSKELAEVTKLRDAERESCIYWAALGEANASLDAESRARNKAVAECERQAEQIQNQARTIVDLDHAVARQDATIKSLREQLLAANDALFQETSRAVSELVTRQAQTRIDWRQGVNRQDAKLADHESKIQTHEARLDAMEEVFDKIKDIL